MNDLCWCWRLSSRPTHRATRVREPSDLRAARESVGESGSCPSSTGFYVGLAPARLCGERVDSEATVSRSEGMLENELCACESRSLKILIEFILHERVAQDDYPTPRVALMRFDSFNTNHHEPPARRRLRY